MKHLVFLVVRRPQKGNKTKKGQTSSPSIPEFFGVGSQSTLNIEGAGQSISQGIFVSQCYW